MFTIAKLPSRSWLLMLILLGALLSSCGTPSTSGPSTPQPATAAPTTVAEPPTAVEPTTVVEPTSVPEPTTPVEPTSVPEPTAAPDTVEVLPAPLYLLTNSPTEDSHVVRLERDGETRTNLVNERPAQDILTLLELDVSPADGSIAYIVQGQEGNSLVQVDADGQNRVELLSNTSVSMPRWSPDGANIVVSVFQAPDATGGLAGGVYLIPAGGGEPQLLQANDPLPDPSDVTSEARGYSPGAWSPDGTHMILNAFSQVVERCDVAVKNLESGEVVTLASPEGVTTSCGTGVWSTDSTTVYVGMRQPGLAPAVPGLWQADIATGETTPFIAGAPDAGQFTLVLGLHSAADGSLYAFLANTDTIPDPVDPNAVLPSFGLYRISADGTESEQIGDATFEQLSENVLWAPDGSGALIETYNDQGSRLTWVPVDGGLALEIAKDISTNSVRWGP